MGHKTGSSLPGIIVIYRYNLRGRVFHASWGCWGLGGGGEQYKALV